MFPILFLLFTIVPVLELYLLITVGSKIGVFPTIAIVILTGIWGAGLARMQGFRVLTEIQNQLANGNLPTQELVHGAMVLTGGLLLLTPGFLTDIMGFLLLIPITRSIFIAAAGRYFRHRIHVLQTFTPSNNENNEDPKTIKVEYREL